MIPLIVLAVIAIYKRKIRKPTSIKKSTINTKLAILPLLIISFSSFKVMAQEKDLSYSIKRNGNKVGSISLKEIQEGDHLTFKLKSEVNTGFIISIKARAEEMAVYQNGVLHYSYVYQKLNKTEKINKETKLETTGYVVAKNDLKEYLKFPIIKYNMICLFTREPVNIPEIFSDKFQQFLTIKKLDEHLYRISFPDGNFNDYYYQNGICSIIKVNHTFYSAIIEIEH